MPTKKIPPPLLYAASETNADALYFGRVSVPDAFVAFEARGRKHAIVSALEFARVKRSSDFDVVLLLERYLQLARERWPARKVGPAEVIAIAAKEVGQAGFSVAPDFPAGIFEKLRALGLGVTVAQDVLFPQRERKTPAEAKAVRDGNRCSAAGIAAAEGVLRASRVKGRKLVYRGATLTSERLKFAIESACLEAGGLSSHTIAAGGDQACDPHERGHGPLRAHELIIVDVFPRMSRTGFHGDMTRTFLRGRASETQRALVETVRAGQRAALSSIRAGVNGRDIHAKIVELFTQRGYETKHTPGGSVGFFHGTGHGLGLDIHEPPRINSSEYVLKKDSVVTVEPGLYYPGLGGCRIEDVVQVTTGAPRMLSRYHYEWELR